MSKKMPFIRLLLATLPTLSLAACLDEPFESDDASEEIDSVEQHLFAETTVLWPKKGNETTTTTVTVCWLTDEYATEKAWVKKRIVAEYGGKTPLRFSGWKDCADTTAPDVRIAIADTGAKVNALGSGLKATGRQMTLNFTFQNWSTGCAANDTVRRACIEGDALHEFGHAAGLAHEQNRPDTFASNTNNACGDAPQGSSGNLAFTAWDPESVMNYCNPLDNNDGRLSRMDVEGLNFLYGGKRKIADYGYGNLPKYLVDVNADGFRDYCRFVGNNPGIFLSCKLGTATSFQSSEYGYNSVAGLDLGNPDAPRYMADVTADGRAEFCRVVGTPQFLSCILAGPQGFWNAQYAFNSVTGLDLGYAGQPRALADVDGDGRADFCRLVGDSFISCNLATANGFGANQYAFNSTTGMDMGYGNLPRSFVDMTGDGQADYCRFVGNKPGIFRACNTARAAGFDPNQYNWVWPADANAEYNK